MERIPIEVGTGLGHIHGILSSRTSKMPQCTTFIDAFCGNGNRTCETNDTGTKIFLIPLSLMLSFPCGFLLVKQFENRINLFNTKSFFSCVMIDTDNLTINVLSGLLPQMQYSSRKCCQRNETICSMGGTEPDFLTKDTEKMYFNCFFLLCHFCFTNLK